jgi:hypothetical protein
MFGAHRKPIKIGENICEIVWKWNIWTGEPSFVALTHENKTLVSYGEAGKIKTTKANDPNGTFSQTHRRWARLKIGGANRNRKGGLSDR